MGRKAAPIILANASVPLLGLVDTAILGHRGTVSDLGAIALGSLIFNFVYWSFGFFRMGASGFIAQAAGRKDEAEVWNTFLRFLLLALLIGITLVSIHPLLEAVAFFLLSASDAVEGTARAYFHLRIWGAPATLGTFVLTGALIGLGQSRKLLYMQLFLNALNMILDVYFTVQHDMGARGIALGTLIAEWVTFVGTTTLLGRDLMRRQAAGTAYFVWAEIFRGSALRKTLVANVDIMVRTLTLIFSFAWFTNQSSLYGDIILAANHILLQFISFSAFFLDGFAFVTESLIGHAIGGRDKYLLQQTVRKSNVLAFGTALGLAALMWLGGPLFIDWLTDMQEVAQQSGQLLIFATIYIAVSSGAFQLDGIFIGASATREMRQAALASSGLFMLSWWLLATHWGVKGLWLSFIVYVVARALALLYHMPHIRARIEPNA